MKEIIGNKNSELPLSEAVRCGDFVFISGQTPPRDSKTGEIKGENIEEQTRMVIEKIIDLVEKVGGNINNIIKATVFIKDMKEFARMNKVYSNIFATDPPARSCIKVELVDESVLIEIEAIAYIPKE